MTGSNWNQKRKVQSKSDIFKILYLTNPKSKTTFVPHFASVSQNEQCGPKQICPTTVGNALHIERCDEETDLQAGVKLWSRMNAPRVRNVLVSDSNT